MSSIFFARSLLLCFKQPSAKCIISPSALFITALRMRSDQLSYIFANIEGLVETREYKRHWTELGVKETIVAPTPIAEKYALLVQPLFEMEDRIHKLNRVLSRKRDLLIPKLVSGQIDVSDFKLEVPIDNYQTSKDSSQSTLDQWIELDTEEE